MREAQLTCARHAALQDFFAIGVTSIRNVVQPRESKRHARVVAPCLRDANGLVDLTEYSELIRFCARPVELTDDEIKVLWDETNELAAEVEVLDLSTLPHEFIVDETVDYGSLPEN